MVGGSIPSSGTKSRLIPVPSTRCPLSGRRGAPFLPVRLVVFPEFAHAAPIYPTVDELRERLALLPYLFRRQEDSP